MFAIGPVGVVCLSVCLYRPREPQRIDSDIDRFGFCLGQMAPRKLESGLAFCEFELHVLFVPTPICWLCRIHNPRWRDAAIFRVIDPNIEISTQS